MQQNQATQSELSTSQNVEEATNRNYSIWMNKPIEGTPFHINGGEEKGYFLRLGDYRITEFKPTPEEVTELLYTEQWNIILTVIAGILHNQGNKNIKIEK